jgi:4-aminobutyrate aminotransferase
MMVIAKGLASGLPLAGVVAPLDLMQRCTPGSEGGTYGGNAVACAAAVASIQVLREEKLIENSAVRGEQLLAGLRQLQARYPGLGEVRGLGLMVGVEFSDAQGKPDKPSAKAVQRACFEGKMLLLTCGTYDNIIRVIPPLVVNAEEIEDGLARFEHALAQVYG